MLRRDRREDTKGRTQDEKGAERDGHHERGEMAMATGDGDVSKASEGREEGMRGKKKGRERREGKENARDEAWVRARVAGG